MIRVTVTEMRKNFSRYIHFVMNGGEIIITKYGKDVVRLTPYEAEASVTDSLTGILKGNADVNEAKDEGLKEKYEIID